MYPCVPLRLRLGVAAGGDQGSVPPRLADTESRALGINNRGQVVGYSTTSSGMRAFLWYRGTMTDLGTLPDTDESFAYGINDHGQVVGYSTSAGGLRAFLWHGGTMTDLGTLPGGTWSWAWGIDNRGQVVGFGTAASGLARAVLWTAVR